VNSILFAIVVLLLNGHPAPNASISCWEITTYNEDGPPEGYPGGLLLPTDSAGRMFFEGFPPFPRDYHCTVWKGSLTWAGILHYDIKQQSQTVTLKEAPKSEIE
jgi:hypothetical protein